MVFFSNQDEFNSEKKNQNKVSFKGGISLITIFFFFNLLSAKWSQAGRSEILPSEFKIFSDRAKKAWSDVYPKASKDWVIGDISMSLLFDQMDDSREALMQAIPIVLDLKQTVPSDQGVVSLPEKKRRAKLRKLLDGQTYFDFSFTLGKGGLKSWRKFVQVESGKQIAIASTSSSNHSKTLVEVLKIADEEPESKLMRMKWFQEDTEVQLLTDVFDTDLGHYLETHTVDLSFKEHIMKDLCSAVTALHSHQILHGDLKPENILLKWDTSEPQSAQPQSVQPQSAQPQRAQEVQAKQGMYTQFRLSDFDFAYHFDDVEKTKMIVGSFPFSPPEVYRKVSESDPILIARRDTFAVGMLALQLFFPHVWRESKNVENLIDLWSEVTTIMQKALPEKQLELESIQEQLKRIDEQIKVIDQHQAIRGFFTSDLMIEQEKRVTEEVVKRSSAGEAFSFSGEITLSDRPVVMDEDLVPEDKILDLQKLWTKKKAQERHAKRTSDHMMQLKDSIQKFFIEIAESFTLFQVDVDAFSVSDVSPKVNNTQLFTLIKNAIKADVHERSDLETFCRQFPSAL